MPAAASDDVQIGHSVKGRGSFSDPVRSAAPTRKALHNSYKVRYAFLVETALAVMPAAQGPILISTSSIF
jgi:hypothetical protein